MGLGLKVQRALAAGVFFARGAFEGVFAAGGEVDAAFPQGHRLFDGDDLEAGNGGETGFLVQARRGGFGDREEHLEKKSSSCRSKIAQIGLFGP